MCAHDWWGIKLAADGKSAGYPVVIFGGEHADIPITEHAGAHVAELFATGNRPCLIDLGGWMVGARTRFWIEFASTLFKHTKGQRWLAVDEIHNFAPKGKVFDADAGKALHWTNRLASEGLGKGVALIFASQRPQKVHNDTLTSAETLIAMRVLHPSDRGAVAEWIKGCGDSEGSEVLQSLAQMDRGEGWVWSPEIGFGPKRVKFPMFSTYDSFRPQTLADTKRLKGWAEVDLDDVRQQLAGVVEQAKQDDPRELRKQIAELRKELAAKRSIPDSKETITERPVLTDADRKLIADHETAIREFHHAILHPVIDACVKKLEADLRHKLQPLVDRLQSVRFQVVRDKVAAAAEHPAHKISRPLRATANPPVVRQLAKHERSVSSDNGDLGKGERKVLTAIAQYPEGVSRDQLTILTGYKRSSRDTYLQRLSQAGFTAAGGNGCIVATVAGVDALGTFEPLPTGSQLRDHWMRTLPEGERVILDVLAKRWPEFVDRDALDDATGYKRSSRDTYLQRLGARRLVETQRGQVKASDALFD
jgi:uncharacterized protein